MKKCIKISNIILAALLLMYSCGSDEQDSKSPRQENNNQSNAAFSGYKWEIRETKNIADSRYFCLTSKKNAFIDKNGNLVLKLSKIGDTWYGGELTLDSILGFGDYSFDVQIKEGLLDANAAFAMTILNVSEEDYEGLTQTGIKFSKYGEQNASNEMEYFLYATDKKISEVQVPENPFVLSQNISSHKIGIYPNYLLYSSKSPGGYFNEFKAMKYNDSPDQIPDALTFSTTTEELKVIFSLCLPESNEPVNKKEIEVLVSNFKYVEHVSDITFKK